MVVKLCENGCIPRNDCPMRAPVFRGFLSTDIIADNFAGGGGASEGIKAALGRPVSVAINHDAAAIAMHTANHPETNHYREDIWSVNPREVCGSRRCVVAWFSPDCTHFSKAKGSQPRKKEIRALANVVIWWAEMVKPLFIFLENVAEFQTWGPVDEHGKPIKVNAGEDFRAWLARLSDLGYRVEYRILKAADYGAPTTRERLFLVARLDHRPIVWPTPTHGKGTPNPFKPAASCIDWSIPCPSIFDRKKPLAPATLKRIAYGIKRFVLDNPAPFIVRHGHYSNRTGAGLIEGKGAGVFRGQSLSQPLATVCATNDKHLVVPKLNPFFVTYYGQSKAHPIEEPLGTITTNIHSALVAPFITKHYGGGETGHVTPGSNILSPLSTVTKADHHALSCAVFAGAKDRSTEVQTLLAQYAPKSTTPKAKQLQLDLTRDGRPFPMHAIIDIGMRMLVPRELFAAQGFRDDYVIDLDVNRKPITKTQQVALAGNSVCPDVARELVKANVMGV